jgi:pantetheine-phosphate adenylyltransferase
VTGESGPGEHAVYPGTFDPVTPGHLDVIGRVRHLYARVTVLVAVNGDKQPAGTPPERATELRQEIPADWDNVSVAAWTGLTAAFCRRHGADVIIRGVRNGSDLRHEYQLAAMNQHLDITTLLVPAQPELTAMSSTVLRGHGPETRRRLAGFSETGKTRPPGGNPQRGLQRKPDSGRPGEDGSQGRTRAERTQRLQCECWAGGGGGHAIQTQRPTRD